MTLCYYMSRPVRHLRLPLYMWISPNSLKFSNFPKFAQNSKFATNFLLLPHCWTNMKILILLSLSGGKNVAYNLFKEAFTFSSIFVVKRINCFSKIKDSFSILFLGGKKDWRSGYMMGTGTSWQIIPQACSYNTNTLITRLWHLMYLWWFLHTWGKEQKKTTKLWHMFPFGGGWVCQKSPWPFCTPLLTPNSSCCCSVAKNLLWR